MSWPDGVPDGPATTRSPFDSSGTALQDVAAAIAVYEKARLTGRGTEVKLED